MLCASTTLVAPACLQKLPKSEGEVAEETHLKVVQVWEKFQASSAAVDADNHEPDVDQVPAYQALSSARYCLTPAVTECCEKEVERSS